MQRCTWLLRSKRRWRKRRTRRCARTHKCARAYTFRVSRAIQENTVKVIGGEEGGASTTRNEFTLVPEGQKDALQKFNGEGIGQRASREKERDKEADQKRRSGETDKHYVHSASTRP